MSRDSLPTFALIALLPLSSCGGGQPPAVSHQYETLQVAPMQAVVRTGSTTSSSGLSNRFVAVATRPDGGTDFSWNGMSTIRNVSWSSSAPNVATIDSIGHFEAVSPGTTTITATFENLSASTTLTVSDTAPLLLRMEMNPVDSRWDDKGNTAAIQLQPLAIYDDNSQQAMTSRGVWASSDITSCSVDSSGWVIFKSMVNCQVTFFYGLAYNSIKFNGPLIPLGPVNRSPDTNSLGSAQQLRISR